MFYPNYKELTVFTKAILNDDGTNCIAMLPVARQPLTLVFCEGINYYAYPLPKELDGKNIIAHVVYHTKDDAKMQSFVGKLGKGNEVCKTAAYKSLVTTTVADVKIAEEKARLMQEAEAKGEVVKQADLDAVKYEAADSNDGVALWVFQNKDYIDK